MKFLFKRILDLIISVICLIVLTPIFFIILIIGYIKKGRPIIFKQERPGKNEKPFNIYKFRTMLDLTDEKGNLLPDEKRLTPLGKFLRKTSLDELPELFNVIKGEMSLVGPRPLLMEYLPLYNKMQKKRFLMKPGITGWAQVKGRNAITWNEKFELDVWYVENWSFFLDIKILIITVWAVIKREGISQNNHVTMEKFRGNDG